MLIRAVLLLSVLTTAAEAAEKKAGLPQLDPTFYAAQLFWLALTFGALYYVLSRLSLPRIAEVIEERRSRIQRDLDEAERLKNETDKALATYEQKLAEARGRAGTMAKETRDKLSGEVDRERAKVDAEVASRIAAAEKTITDKKTAALAEVGAIAADTAGDIIKRLSGEQVSADDIRRALGTQK